MHAIMHCAITPSSDAGRLPIYALIPSRPFHNVVDVLEAAALDSEVIKPAEDTPVAQSPVPVKHKRARFSLDDIVLADQIAFIKHIKTLDRLEALGMLEGRTPRPIQEEMFLNWWNWPTLQYCMYLNRVDALAILEGSKAHPGQENLLRAGLPLPSCAAGTVNKGLDRQVALSGNKDSGDDSSIVLAEPETSLKRARKINKRAGLEVLKRRESRKARLLGGPILQAHLRP